MSATIDIQALRVLWPGGRGVHGVSLQLHPGQRMAVVGRSGCGKSTLGRALLGLCDAARVDAARLQVCGCDLLSATGETLRKLRGAGAAMVFQDPLATLDPLQRVGAGLIEAAAVHESTGDAELRERAVAILREVGIREPEAAMRAWPHELSGGQRQRVGIAMAMMARPRLIIADEPTSALDPPLARQVAAVLRRACEARGAALLLITHDLLLAGALCDDIVVLDEGLAVERGIVGDVLRAPGHPATAALVRAAGLDRGS